MDSNSMYTVLFGAMLAEAVITHPLDVMRVRAQLGMHPAYDGEGWYLFGRGLLPNILSRSIAFGIRHAVTPMASLYMHQEMKNRKISVGDYGQLIALGALSGLLETVAFLPTDRLKIRMQSHTVPYRMSPSIGSEFSNIVSEHSGSLFKGFTVTALRQCILGATLFVCFDYFARNSLRYDPSPSSTNILGGVERLRVGVSAGLCAAVAVHPLDVLKTRIQYYHEPLSLRGAFQDVLTETGVRGLYYGVWYRALQIIGGTMIGMVVFDSVLLSRNQKRSQQL